MNKLLYRIVIASKLASYYTPKNTHRANVRLRYDAIRDAVLTCARKPT